MFTFIQNIKKVLKKNHSLILLYNLPLIIFIFHFLLNSDFRFVSYDSEPDYIMNGLHILDSGRPIDGHHPGTFTYYITAVLIKFCSLFNLELSDVILLIRSVFISFWVLALFTFNKNNILKVYLFILVILISPGIKFFLSNISAEILLFPMCLLISHSLKNNNYNTKFIGVSCALAMSVKLSFLIVMPILVIKLLKKLPLKEIINIFIIFSVSIIIIELPVLPQFIYTLINKLKIMSILRFISTSLELGSLYYPALIVVIIISSILLLFFRYKNYILRFLVKNSDVLINSYIVILVIMLIFNNFKGWTNVRNFIPILPFALDALKVNKLEIKSIVIGINFLFLLLLIFGPIDHIDYDLKTSFDDFVDQNEEKNIIVPMNDCFYSEYLFKEWSQFRYGNSAPIWGDNWARANNLELLNTRYLESCENFKKYNKNDFFENWFKKKNTSREYYPRCIDDQISSIFNGSSLFITFNQTIFSKRYELETIDYLNKIKKTLEEKGFIMFKTKVKDQFTIWNLKKIDS
jgi:hypothetical protein